MHNQVNWQMSGDEIERESFRRIDELASRHFFSPAEWHVARRLIHTTGDFSIIEQLRFRHDPIPAGLAALAAGAPLFCDSNMVRSGVSVARLRQLNPCYEKASVHCYIADSDVALAAAARGTTRALAAVEKARPLLAGAVVLIGNAPLALAKIVQLAEEEGLRPALVIGIPVGFVNVIEAKAMLAAASLPQIVVEGRRGGSALAVAALHGIIENHLS
ncbi:MAG TPA: precorrin-8X methylmutase [Proteobacteria bacterium]|nr:precorrin-8X methylmutase [Pseudomonadota bacterium]